MHFKLQAGIKVSIRAPQMLVLITISSEVALD